MSKYYPVMEVDQSWILKIEEMGGRDKFWYEDPESRSHWLFKFPRKGTGEHWAEKIASEVAALLGIDHASTELATIGNERGSVSKSFVAAGQQLTHGNQLLLRGDQGYDAEKKFKQSDHTLERIWNVMQIVFENPEREAQAKERIGENLVLDALIGNTDRHHENWGLLARKVIDHLDVLVAPSFDHASALGRELLDPKRVSLLSNGRVGSYVERGRGAIYREVDASGALSPLELVRRTVSDYPAVLQPVLGRVGSLDDASLSDIVDRVPLDWMSRPARDFAHAMLCYAMKELRKLL